MAVSIGSPVARGGWLLALVVVVVASGCSSTSTTCPTDQTSCGGVCVDLASNPLYCGACNVSCNAGASCVGGVCACPAGQASCGLVCVDQQTDPANCGRCGRSCGLGTCAAGACVCNTTPATVELCPNDAVTGTCVDKASSGANCGACGNVCIAGHDLLDRDLPVPCRPTPPASPGPPRRSAPTSRPTAPTADPVATPALRVHLRVRGLPARLRDRPHHLHRRLRGHPDRPRQLRRLRQPLRLGQELRGRRLPGSVHPPDLWRHLLPGPRRRQLLL